jgi:hypothetical protein
MVHSKGFFKLFLFADKHKVAVAISDVMLIVMSATTLTDLVQARKLNLNQCICFYLAARGHGSSISNVLDPMLLDQGGESGMDKRCRL